MPQAGLTPLSGEDKAEARGKYLFLFLPPHVPKRTGASRGRLARGGLASAPSGTAAIEVNTGVGAGARLASPAVLVQHWCRQQLCWFLVWGSGNNVPQVRSLAKKLQWFL